MPNDDHIRQSIQEWTTKKLWKTAFKKFEVTFNFLKAIFNKFFFVHSWILLHLYSYCNKSFFQTITTINVIS